MELQSIIQCHFNNTGALNEPKKKTAAESFHILTFPTVFATVAQLATADVRSQADPPMLTWLVTDCCNRERKGQPHHWAGRKYLIPF